MQNMNDPRLDSLDLGSLRLLGLLLETLSVTRSAERLGVSQPTASRGLARLRAALGDELLVRARGGYALTPRAERLRPLVADASAALERVFAPARFDPGTSAVRFRVAANDHGALTVLAPALARLSLRAPFARLDVAPVEPDAPTASLSKAPSILASGPTTTCPPTSIRGASSSRATRSWCARGTPCCAPPPRLASRSSRVFPRWCRWCSAPAAGLRTTPLAASACPRPPSPCAPPTRPRRRGCCPAPTAPWCCPAASPRSSPSGCPSCVRCPWTRPRRRWSCAWCGTPAATPIRRISCCEGCFGRGLGLVDGGALLSYLGPASYTSGRAHEARAPCHTADRRLLVDRL
ncbi:MAG: LysR family transcriptional regulator [Deltaproteobacteria bacterium]|nr:LysR family transcriptional regulator [Deltaproteobacteria bacterium]